MLKSWYRGWKICWPEVRAGVGKGVGQGVGHPVGVNVGIRVGDKLGPLVGLGVGFWVGLEFGMFVGLMFFINKREIYTQSYIRYMDVCRSTRKLYLIQSEDWQPWGKRRPKPFRVPRQGVQVDNNAEQEGKKGIVQSMVDVPCVQSQDVQVGNRSEREDRKGIV
jgi:hypothetical protein